MYRSNRHYYLTSTSNGFTLVELSIVLSIIGLLVGGVIAGQTLLRSADLRGAVSEVDNYKISIEQFQLQYNALPGDFNNGWSYWGTDCAVDAGTCNGDNDNQIAAADEQFIAWRQLVLARLISGSYSGTGTNATIGTNVPASNYIPSAGFSLLYKTSSGGWVDKRGRATARNNIILAADGTNAELRAAVITPDDAHYIDLKFDDGQPDVGWILAEDGNGLTGCTTEIGPTDAEYDFDQLDLRCRLYFNINN